MKQEREGRARASVEIPKADSFVRAFAQRTRRDEAVEPALARRYRVPVLGREIDHGEPAGRIFLAHPRRRIAVAMGVNPADIAAHPFAILGGAAGLILVKGAIIFGLARRFRLATATALETAILVAPGGEFAFVLLNAATGAKLIDPGATSIVLAAVSLTMV